MVPPDLMKACSGKHEPQLVEDFRVFSSVVVERHCVEAQDVAPFEEPFEVLPSACMCIPKGFNFGARVKSMFFRFGGPAFVNTVE